MSGGYFDYNQYHILEMAIQIEGYVKACDEDLFFRPETLNEFKVAARKLREAAVYAQRIDWLLSGDDGEDSFHKRLDEDLRAATPPPEDK